jgi:predicted transcriptional regulator
MRKVSLPCENVARYILPLFNLTQIKAAEKLGTTQAAISQYINSKRGYKGEGKLEEALTVIQETATKIAKEISTGKIDTDEVMSNFCMLCVSIREKGKTTRVRCTNEL